MASSSLHPPLLEWYAVSARSLPWRQANPDPWGVLVSEIMLQQTPVNRVLPAWETWMTRWPSPHDLAAEPTGEAVRMWGRLGYPRRALRLHAAAVACVEKFGGRVPTTYEDLRSLPGVGDYTAAAVLAFAYGRRSVVLDTNVRRALARLLEGKALAGPSVTKAERRRAEEVLPDDEATAALWSVALMELGALVCTATSPSCTACPVATMCTWLASGRPAHDGPIRAAQPFAGTDRQVRGLIMAVVRDAETPVAKASLDAVWPDPMQRERALDSLVVDGLVDPLPDGTYGLPTS